jgi:AraC-like DNA-binding protein
LTTKRPRNRQKGDSAAKQVTDAKVLQGIAAGKSVGQVADELGMHRTTVSKILNSEETKAKISEIQGRLAYGIDGAIEVFIRAIEDYDQDRTTALSAARDLLKNFGALQTKLELNHQFPKPVVIERINGTTVVLGSMADVKEGEE